MTVTGLSAWWARFRRPLRIALGLALVVASALYVYGILEDSFDRLAREHYSLGYVQWFALVSGILGTLLMSTLYHVLATRRIEGGTAPATRVGLAYALGQVVRYLPGKVLGVLFQTRYLTGVLRASTIMLSLIVQTLYDYAWTFAFAGSLLLAWHQDAFWPLLAMPLAGLLAWLAHARGWCERTLLLFRPVRRFFSQEQLGGLRNPPHAGTATLVLLAEWVPMMLGIGFALEATMGWPHAFLIGAIYLAASMASLLVFVVPSGLVVREALFVWLGLRYGFDGPLLVFIGLVFRAAMTLAEALNAVVLLGLDALRRRTMIPSPTGAE